MLTRHQLDLADARDELALLASYLKENEFFEERDIVRLLKRSPNRTVLIGPAARGMILADPFKYACRIQGAVSADLRPQSIFAQRAIKQLRQWSHEIEHATGQIIDWSWALSDVERSAVLASNLGVETLDVQYIVICGRDAALDSDLLRQRFAYRHSRLNIAGSSVVFLTYDGFLREVSHALAEFRTEGLS